MGGTFLEDCHVIGQKQICSYDVIGSSIYKYNGI